MRESYDLGALKTFQIIHFALVMGVTLFGGVTLFLHKDDAFFSQDTSQDDMILVILPAALILMILGSIVGEKNWKQVKATMPSQMLSALQTAHIMKLALHEGAALITLVFFLLTGNYIYIVAAAVVWIRMITLFPTKGMVDRKIEGKQNDYR